TITGQPFSFSLSKLPRRDGESAPPRLLLINERRRLSAAKSTVKRSHGGAFSRLDEAISVSAICGLRFTPAVAQDAKPAAGGVVSWRRKSRREPWRLRPRLWTGKARPAQRRESYVPWRPFRPPCWKPARKGGRHPLWASRRPVNPVRTQASCPGLQGL